MSDPKDEQQARDDWNERGRDAADGWDDQPNKTGDEEESDE